MTKKIISQTHTNEEVIKKSLFISVCAQVESAADFQYFLHQNQDLNATHNCWAYRIGNEYRFNDDGEPSGTAGKPILSAIDGADYDCIGAIVIRHYGGIKLGTGGLARAYGGTIAKNLQTAPFTIHVPTASICIQLPFEYNQIAFKIADEMNATLSNQVFNEKGMNCEITIAEKDLESLKQTLTNATKGQARFISTEDVI